MADNAKLKVPAGARWPFRVAGIRDLDPAETPRSQLAATTTVLTAIERKRPVIAVCGHIHQCWGREAAIGTTPVVNAGPEGRLFEI